MNYYPHHIGDFNSETRHCNRLERSIYRDMRDLYFELESALPAEESKLFRRLLVISPEEQGAARQVLADFFELTESGWFNQRCQDDIQKYQDGLEKASAGGKAKAAKRKTDANQSAQVPLDLDPATFAQDASNVPATFAQDAGTLREGANQNQNQNQNQGKPNPAAQPTQIEDCARGASPVDLSIALRQQGVRCQPADPRLFELSRQGLTVETVVSACTEAKKTKGGEEVKLGYLVAILQRWCAEAAQMRVAGAMPQARASPGGESAKDRARRETIEGLTGKKKHEQPPQFVDINPLA